MSLKEKILTNNDVRSFIVIICLVILTLGAAEARIALALLASITQRFGSDMIKSLSINKCSGNNLIKIFENMFDRNVQIIGCEYL